MLALAVAETSVRQFMNRLLREEIFDAFELRSIEILSHFRIFINGETHDEAGASYIKWDGIKPMLTEIVKFGGKPKFMKVVFSMSDVSAVHNNAKALFLNLTYENDGVNLTTASAQKEFALDKSLDAAWDKYIIDFFNEGKIPIKIL